MGGARRLLLITVGSPAAKVVKSLQPRSRLALQFNPDGEIPDLVADCVDAAADELVALHGGPPRTQEAFDALVEASRTQLHTLTAEVVRRVETVLTAGPGDRDRHRRRPRPRVCRRPWWPTCGRR